MLWVGIVPHLHALKIRNGAVRRQRGRASHKARDMLLDPLRLHHLLLHFHVVMQKAQSTHLHQRTRWLQPWGKSGEDSLKASSSREAAICTMHPSGTAQVLDIALNYIDISSIAFLLGLLIACRAAHIGKGSMQWQQ